MHTLCSGDFILCISVLRAVALQVGFPKPSAHKTVPSKCLQNGHNVLKQSQQVLLHPLHLCSAAASAEIFPVPSSRAQQEVQAGLRFVEGGVRGSFMCTPSPKQRPCRQGDFCGSQTMVGLWAVNSHLQRSRYLGKCPARQKNWASTK